MGVAAVWFTCPVLYTALHQTRATVLSDLRPQTYSSTVISDVTLLFNRTKFTQPQTRCLTHLYNYMVFYSYKHAGNGGRGVHRYSALLYCSVFNHVSSTVWWASGGGHRLLVWYWTIRSVQAHTCQELELFFWVHCGKVFCKKKKKICTTRLCDWINLTVSHMFPCLRGKVTTALLKPWIICLRPLPL